MTVRFSASAADRLMTCPGSANLAEAIPGWQEPVRDPTAGAKGIGTNVHEVLAEVSHWPDTEMKAFADVVFAFQGLHYTKRNKVLLDDTSTEAYIVRESNAELYGDTVRETFKQTAVFTPKMMRFIAEAVEKTRVLFARKPFSRWASERSYEVTWLQTEPQTTPDLWILRDDGTLVVVDFKSGVIPIEASNNRQLLYYAATVVYEEELSTVQRIEMHIIQPGHMSDHTVTRKELTAWMDEAKAAEQRILNKDLSLVPSDKGCQFCPANPHSRGDKGTPLCPAMMDLLYPPVIDDEIYAGL